MSELLRRMRRGLSEPHLLVRQFNKLYYRLIDPRDTTNVFEEDWDTLVILDACRYDVFASCHDLPGELQKRTLRSASTVDFIHQYIAGADLRDTVYVTANPQLRRYREEFDINVHRVVDIWGEEWWDDALSTVHPETVTEEAIKANEQYPNKRLVVHYIQPHHPFIGPTGREKLRFDSIGRFWNRVLTNEISVSDQVIRRAYRENLEIALDSVGELLDEIEGKTVVTADHGEMLGESASPIPITEYGHYRGLRTPELTTVPWLTYQTGPRREVTTGETESIEQSGQRETVESRLEDLGYV
jgi:hypothetical protein